MRIIVTSTDVMPNDLGVYYEGQIERGLNLPAIPFRAIRTSSSVVVSGGQGLLSNSERRYIGELIRRRLYEFRPGSNAVAEDRYRTAI